MPQAGEGREEHDLAGARKKRGGVPEQHVRARGPAGQNVAAGYTVHRAMVSWALDEQLSLQLNANNLFDKQYFTRVRNNGWATPGDARSLVLSATYRF